MSRDECTRFLGGWEGYRVGRVHRFEAGEKGPSAQVWIELLACKRRRMRCGGCGRWVSKVHDHEDRRVRDLPVLDAQTHLLVWRRRVRCPVCGPKLEALPWLGRYARVTKRLSESVGRLCEVMTVKHAAEYFGLSWWAVKAIDKGYLKEKLGPVDLSDVSVIAMDEFAIQKGHRYATVVVDPRSRRVLWVGRGRGRESIRAFFQLLGQERCKRIEAVAMDMNGAYEVEARAWCPGAEIVYDLFHVVAKYAREVVVRVRREEIQRMASEGMSRRVIRGSRWLLLRSQRTIGPEDRIRLRDLLDANRNLMKVYVLGEDLRRLWSYRYPWAARRFWKGWYRRAMQSGIALLRKFAQRLDPYLPGIVAHCRYRLHTSLLEGMNNKIKVIKRMAYGFRDDDYFFLKIRAAFPGIPR